MKENLMRDFVFSEKKNRGRGRKGSQKDFSISTQKGSRGCEDRYGFVMRNNLIDLVLEGAARYVKFGIRKNYLYFIPVTNISDGYSFHNNKSGRNNDNAVYASFVKSALKALDKFLDKEPLHLTMKYDQKLELYYVDLLQEDRYEN